MSLLRMLKDWASYQEARTMHKELVRRSMTDVEVQRVFLEGYNPVATLLKESNPYRYYLLKMQMTWAKGEMLKVGMDPREMMKWL